ncbi:MAG: Gfo/Idh/MocA family oxidoreductase [Armatimonadetes bacterium]|nr:Gfo/Idh/MocA family oxidoreductase [Armatimonadota bacterium]
MRRLRTALVGVGGMGSSHRRLLHESEFFELVAADERYHDRQAEAVAETRQWGVPVYEDYWEMLDAHDDLDLVVIAAPHPWHGVYSVAALERGLHVFVEKPVTVTVQEGLALLDAIQESGRLVGVHHQWTSTGATRELKDFLCAGSLGKVKEVTAIMKWYRSQEYFERNEWAGRRYVEKLPCWDGVLLNQGVHLINSALQLSTRQPGYALPSRVQAEVYRIHDIQTEDLACLRCELDEGALHIYLTLCADKDHSPSVVIRGEHGEAEWNGTQATVKLHDGTEVVFDDEPQGDDTHRNMAACILGLESRLYCPAQEALKATITVNAAYLSAGRIRKLSAEQAGDVGALIDAAAARGALFSELPTAPKWTVAGEIVETADVTSFDGLEDDPEFA